MFRVTTFDCLSSTNNLVKRALENGESEGYVVCARKQTGGYGRQGRVWSSPEGGLYLSVLLRPAVSPDKLSTLSLAVAVGVMRACEKACSKDCEPEREGEYECWHTREHECENKSEHGYEGEHEHEHDGSLFFVKWPNDVVVLGSSCANGQVSPYKNSQVPLCENGQEPQRENNRALSCESAQGASCAQISFQKLCGISLEAHAGGVCVGIGINAFRDLRAFAESAAARLPATCEKNVPAYLEDFGFHGTLDELRASVLCEIELVYRKWAQYGLSAFSEEWDKRDALAGSSIALADRNGALVAQGCAEGIDESGRLLMRLSDGSRFAASSGEVHIV